VKLVGEKFGITNQYTDVDQMLAQNGLDAVVVCTSTDAHQEATLAALRAGKDVLVEKPIARTYQEALAMATAARESKRKLMVGMNHRFRPDTMILKSFIEGKELGKIYYTRVGWLKKFNLDKAWFRRKVGGGPLSTGIVIGLRLDIDTVSRALTQTTPYEQRNEDTSVVTLTLNSGAGEYGSHWSMSLLRSVLLHSHGQRDARTCRPHYQ